MIVAIYGRPLTEAVHENIKTLFSALEAIQSEIFIHESFEKSILRIKGIQKKYKTFLNLSDVPIKPDFFISIGGDGTLLDSTGIVGKSGIPLVGVNAGRLGFLSSVQKEEIESAIQNLYSGNYSVDKRSLIRLETGTNLFGNLNFALNEFTIHKKDTASLITIHTFINDEFLNSYWSDGLIISTPTGSTGYSMSCGGPIVSPDSSNFIITPISSHNLNVRPFVVSDNCVVKLKVEGRSDSFLISLDSRSAKINAGTELVIRKETFGLNLVRFENDNFLTTLRNKLHWGLDKRN